MFLSVPVSDVMVSASVSYSAYVVIDIGVCAQAAREFVVSQAAFEAVGLIVAREFVVAFASDDIFKACDRVARIV